MTLRDHFRPPLSERASWEEVHGQWPAVIVQQLGKILPPQYVAGPRVHLGSRAEVDIASFEQFGSTAESIASTGHNHDADTIIAAVWTATEPTLVIDTELGDFDEYEVRVYDATKNRRLVAAIELISPANKDRPGSRQQFVSKCAALLRQYVSVILVDVVGTREFNLYAELLELIGHRDRNVGEQPAATYAVACHWFPHGNGHCLQAWYNPMSVGEPLPTLPLWLSQQLVLPLDLDASYEQTCRDLRIT